MVRFPVSRTLPGLFGVLAVACSATTQSAAPASASPAERVATTAHACTALGDFYWEIGDANGVRASGQVGSDYGANTEIKIASASKWIWGAYVLEKTGGKLTDDQAAMLQMRSGYNLFKPVRCVLARSVQSCMDARGNGERESATVGKFSYGGGHSQKLAVALGLGGMNASQLTAEVRRALGADLDFSFNQPQPAGGMQSTPATYGQFLRKILQGKLRMREFLGARPVCTLPGSCPGAVSSPAKEAWHYSLNHWIEDAPGSGDGAFSSPGLMGFYPWISADKRWYGIVARQKLSAGAYWDSALCGREIRKAWIASNP